MSVARTNRRRRKQYATGNLVAIFGKAAPRYRKQSEARSARKEARRIALQQRMQNRGK